MITLEQIENLIKGTLDAYKEVCDNQKLEMVYRGQLLSQMRNKFQELMDEMTGEEVKLDDKSEIGKVFDKGYNTKVKELKEYKDKFNK